tara:strand:+ start:189 stop:2525 length:2337 start_codon:yes stop_codon:yes gene_type:complete
MKKSIFLLAMAVGFASYGQSFEQIDSIQVELDEVRVISSFAVDRKTPVAASTVTAKTIAEVYGGSAELPEVLKLTPGVYTTKTGGGTGDGRINIRGFDQRNIAVTINGIPVNDMESGWVYWSNWAGLGDAVSAVQVQRGLGASKLAINSVGGTMNIITKSTDAKAGSSFQTQMTDYGQYKVTAYASTGLMENGFALTTVLSRTGGNGYVDGTWTDGYSYFITAAKRLGDKQRLVLTAIGAPQSHGQRTYGLSESDVEDYGVKYNRDYGKYDDGEIFNERVNYYHKPQVSLNHYFNPTSRTSINTSAYVSIGHGGGSGRLGSSYSRTAEGLIDIESAIAYNTADTNASLSPKYVQRNSVNNHNWYGLVSTMNHKLTDNLDMTLGVDFRSYKGEHFREVRNLLGGGLYNDWNNGSVGVNDNASNYGNVFAVTPEDQRVAYDNDGLVKYGGIFGQVEYSKDKLSAFLTGAVNTTSNQRIERMRYDNDSTREEASEIVVIPGYSFKGGINYNINENHNVYVNAGQFSRAPFFSFVFVNYSNDVVQNLLNEKATSFELGYGYTSKKLSAKVNLYSTDWKDKSLLSGNIPGPNGTLTRALMTGASARHNGAELEFMTRFTEKLELGGLVSLGDWRWRGDINSTVYSEIDPTISTTVTSYVDGIHVGNAPQSQYGLQARYQLTKKLYLGGTFLYNDRFYAQFDPARKTDVEDKIDSYQIPSFYNVDARLGYDVNIGDYKLQLSAQGFNITNVMYWSDVTDNGSGGFAYGFPGFGRNFNLSAKFIF